MALQHTRYLQWQAEDLGFGGQRSVRRQIPSTVQATQPLYVATPAFLSSSTLPTQLLGTTYSSAVTGFNRIIINRSNRYWMTLTCTISDTGTKTVQVALAPYQVFFLPTNFIAVSATIAADSSFPVILPTNIPSIQIPKAGTTVTLSYDFVRES